MGVADTRVVVGRHSTESTHNTEGSEWGSDNDNRRTCR